MKHMAVRGQATDEISIGVECGKQAWDSPNPATARRLVGAPRVLMDTGFKANQSRCIRLASKL